MKRKLLSHLITLAVMAGLPTAFGSGLVDLGPAGIPNFDSNVGNNKPTYIVDVSKDGALAGATDNSGNGFIWTAGTGKVLIGAGYALVGADWLSGRVLAVGNSSANYPSWWQGNFDGSGGSWTSLPPMDGTSGSGGYWQATSLGVKADNSDWWLAGFRNNPNSPYRVSNALSVQHTQRDEHRDGYRSPGPCPRVFLRCLG